MNGYEWLWMVMNDYEWLGMIRNDYEWLWMVMNGYEWLWMIMNGYEWGMMKSYVGSETRIGEWGGETFRCAWSNCNLEEEDGDQQLAQIPVCGGKNNKIDMTIVIEIVRKLTGLILHNIANIYSITVKSYYYPTR